MAKAAPKPEPAKPEASVNKSEAIRAALLANPSSTNVQIAHILQAKDIEATPAYISIIKSKMKKAGAPAAASSKRQASAPAAAGFAAVNAAADLVSATGGIEQAKAALEALQSILDKTR